MVYTCKYVENHQRKKVKANKKKLKKTARNKINIEKSSVFL